MKQIKMAWATGEPAMIDIVERLEARLERVQELDCIEWVPDKLCQQAAAEITRLRAELAEARPKAFAEATMEGVGG